MPRIEIVGIEQAECRAARAITELADLIQDLAFYLEGQGIAADTLRAVAKAYRVLKPTTESYLGADSPLLWNAPEFRFQKKGTKC